MLGSSPKVQTPLQAWVQGLPVAEGTLLAGGQGSGGSRAPGLRQQDIFRNLAVSVLSRDYWPQVRKCSF